MIYNYFQIYKVENNYYIKARRKIFFFSLDIGWEKYSGDLSIDNHSIKINFINKQPTIPYNNLESAKRKVDLATERYGRVITPNGKLVYDSSKPKAYKFTEEETLELHDLTEKMIEAQNRGDKKTEENIAKILVSKLK